MPENLRPFERLGQIKSHYPFGTYPSYSRMSNFMRTTEFYYPHLVKIVRIGTSHEGRPIEGLKV